MAVGTAAFALRRQTPSFSAQCWLGALLGGCVLMRWANIYFAASVVFAYFAAGYQMAELSDRARRLATMCVGIAVIVLPVWIRNWIGSRTLTGDRPIVISSVVEKVGLAVQGMADFVQKAHLSLERVPPAAIAHSALTLALSAYVLLSVRRLTIWRGQFTWTIVLSYFGLMLLTATTTDFDPLDEPRFWLLVPPLFVAGIVAVLAEAQQPRWVRQAAVLGCLIFVGHATHAFASNFFEETAGPVESSGFFHESFKTSEVIRGAISHADAGRCRLAANDPRPLFPYVDSRPVMRVPRKPRALVGSGHEPVCLVLFHDRVLPSAAHGRYEPIRAHLASMNSTGRARRESRDRVAELWRLD